VGKQAAREVVGRLNCLLKNNMHLERLAIMKWRGLSLKNSHILWGRCPELTQVVKIKE
jgi:hypothetical protein